MRFDTPYYITGVRPERLSVCSRNRCSTDELVCLATRFGSRIMSITTTADDSGVAENEQENERDYTIVIPDDGGKAAEAARQKAKDAGW